MRKPLLIVLILFFSPAVAADAPNTPSTQAPVASAPATPEENPIPEKTLKQIAVLISSQVRPCWKIPASANSAPLQAIISIDKSGNLTFVDFANPVAADQQQVADSVKDAIADPKCNPIKKLPPPELYDVWQNLTLLFAPKN